MDKDRIKQSIIDHCLKMLKDGLTKGTGGNISIRAGEHVYITPSGVDYEMLNIKDISVVVLETGELVEGKKPSSEKEFHLGIYKARKDVSSIVHTHSVYSTILGCLKMELPPVHYLVALSGDKVPVADYALFGSHELSENILKAIGDYNAVFMANHGLVAVGEKVESAYSVALNIEFASEVYVKSLSIGNPVLLGENRINDVRAKLNNYMNPYFSNG